MDNYYLKHYGVKGMKWGERRAQRKQAKSIYRAAKNAAKEKYRKSEDSINRKSDRNIDSFDKVVEMYNSFRLLELIGI